MALAAAPAVAYESSGPWRRAYYDNYSICGEGRQDADTNQPPGFYARGYAITYTVWGPTCDWSNRVVARISGYAQIYGWTGGQWVQCGYAQYFDVMASTMSTNFVLSGFLCRYLTTWYTTATWHGGWISGVQFPHGATYPLTTSVACYGSGACPPRP